jgi:aspartate aminotransferase
MIAGYGAVPIRALIDMQTLEPDLNVIASAISPKTRAIIVNSPNNPTGKIYSSDCLQRLAALLMDAQKKTGRPIYLLSDESYSRILFDGRAFHSPTRYYPYSMLLYTYGKTLLTPGQRIGYIVLPPEMPDREELREAILVSQLITGYAFPMPCSSTP